MVNLTFYNEPPPSNPPPGGLIEIQEKVENETVLNKPQGGKSKQQFIVKYDWNSYIFNVKKFHKEWKIIYGLFTTTSRFRLYRVSQKTCIEFTMSYLQKQ